MLSSRMLSQHALAPRFKLKHKKKGKEKEKASEGNIIFQRQEKWLQWLRALSSREDQHSFLTTWQLRDGL